MSVYENEMLGLGAKLVAGADEAGRGPLAGPIVAAAVILSPEKPIIGVNDSKKLSAKVRERLYEEIMEKATAVGVAMISAKDIDSIGIGQANLMVLRDAVRSLSPATDAVLSDYFKIPGLEDIMQKSIVKGDANSVSIAAASIIAKVTRDRIMIEADELYPGYGFAKHKGYGTKAHYAAINAQGLCEIHRRTFLRGYFNG